MLEKIIVIYVMVDFVFEIGILFVILNIGVCYIDINVDFLGYY